MATASTYRHDVGVHLRNSEHGYGLVTKSLHWLTVALLLVQFLVGYLMTDDGSGQGRGRGHRAESVGGGHDRGRGRGGEDQVLDLLPLHVGLGLAILTIAIVRVFWRLSTPLPPWAATLSETEKRVAHRTERALLALLFVIPATGLLLVLGDDDLLAVHVTAHVAFFVALATHVALVLGHRARTGTSLLARMT